MLKQKESKKKVPLSQKDTIIEEIRIAICDDDEYYINIIKKRIEKFQTTLNTIHLVVDTFQDAKEFQDQFMQDGYDLVYLDIKLSDENGMHIAEALHQSKPDCLIIFITNYMSYFNQSFLVEAFQYMKKPIKEKFFNSELNRAIEKIRVIKQTVIFSMYDNNYVFDTKDIYYIETAYKQYIVHTTRGEFRGSIHSFQEFKSKHKRYNFFQIQRSFFVNLMYVDTFNFTWVTLKTGEELSISKFKYQEFKKIMRNYADS